ncbi:MAG: CBS domain-containing protein [Chthoniobacterales bacterium]|nr:CBS domain-containing protein [Chthoniobacterales bacterium]
MEISFSFLQILVIVVEFAKFWIEGGARISNDFGMTNDFPVSLILDRKGHKIYSVSPNQTVFEAIQLMAEKNIGALAVLEGQRLVGMISERDYTRKVILRGRVSKETPVSEIMTPKPLTVAPKTTVKECLEIMTANHIRHLPVLEDDLLIGIVSIGDLVNFIIQVQSNEIEDLKRYLAGGYAG